MRQTKKPTRKTIKTRRVLHRFTAFLLCLCMLLSLAEGIGSLRTWAAPEYNGPTDVNTRQADPNTMETYKGKLLSGLDGSSSETTGSRYAGRVWSDKTVLRYEEAKEGNPLQLTMAEDGYESTVSVDADFLHVYSTLTSSQVVNEYPPSPIDLVIVFDMSGSMGQDTRYSIDQGGNWYQEHTSEGDPKDDPWPQGGVPMAERIENSRVQKTLDAINNTIDGLMAQNEQNRVAVCGYGANAAVLLPLAHYRHTNKDHPEPYLSVGGMETLYHPSDLVYKDKDEDGVADEGWYWQNNRDTCYTVVVNAGNESSDYTGPLHDSEGKGEDSWKAVKTRTVSNNVKGNSKAKDDVKAFPGVAKQDADGLETSKDLFKDTSRRVYDGAKGGMQYAAKSAELTKAMADTDGLEADDYVGYFTNTQGGIYLAYKQLADSKDTTYAEKLTNGVLSTVARIPAAIIMSDGGANFAFNEMGNDRQSYTVQAWNARYGTKSGNETYINDDAWDSTNNEGRYKDALHRLGGIPGEGIQYNTGDEWYKVFLPGKDTLGEGWDGLHGIFNIGADFYADGTLSSQPEWNHAGVLYSSDNDRTGVSGTTLQVLLTASYMNRVVKEHYANGWAKNGATEESRVPLSTFTMNVDTEHVPQWGRMRLFPTLDPLEYPLDALGGSDLWYTKEEKFGGSANGDFGVDFRKLLYDGLYNSWSTFKAGNPTDAAHGHNGDIRIHIAPIVGSVTYEAGGGDDPVQITNQEVVENIAYNDKFYDVDSEKLGDIFKEILSIIQGKVFVPVSGSNDAGVGNSITYQDPIGLYMELKHDAVTATPYHTDSSLGNVGPQTYDMAMLLFGEMHGVLRTGVYDYEWIQQYESVNGSSSFTPGWYLGEDGAKAQKTAGTKRDDSGSTYPKECKSPQDAWKQGWVMRLDFNTLAEYVPIVEEQGEQTQNTTYTVYRFSCPQDDRNKLRINPVYGEKVPDTVQKAWDEASAGGSYPVGNAIYAGTPGVYRLSDIRIWTEDTGDFVDEDGVLAPNTGYDTSLYVNIPAAALPTQLAEITMGSGGVMSYKTNLGADHKDDEANYAKYCAQSTPFRLFYAVGVDDYLINRDASGRQTGINVAMLPDDYIKTHTENGRVYFYSNYYSGSVYQGYGSDAASEYRTMGDPTVSFAAGTDNRYYVYQKPLPLYAHAYRVSGETLQPVDKANNDNEPWSETENQIGGNGAGDWKDGTDGGTWAGGRYMGVYDNQEKFKEALDAAKGADNVITDRNGVKYKVVEGGIVFLQSDLLDQVRAKEDGSGYADGSVSFSSSDYFFLALEFYLPDKSRKGTNLEGNTVNGTFAGEVIQYVVSRKGGAFGSELHAENIGNGDMLCWTDIGPNSQGLQLEYLSYTVTGDRFRGEPAWELFTKDRDELETYLRERGLKDVAPAEGEKSPLQEAVDYWLEVQKEYRDTLMRADASENGGDGNGTVEEEEFNTYFHWAVATKPGGLRVGDMFRNMQAKSENTTNTANNFYVPTVSPNARIGDIVINNYLGNNGRLYVENSHLYVGKLIDIPEDDPNRDALLKTRFEYQVYIQNYTGPMDAVVLRWNRLGNSGNGTWQRQMNTIDVLTSNEGLLLDGDKTTPSVVGKVNGRWEHLRAYTGGGGDPVYYLYEDLDENGQPIEGKQPVTVADGNYYYIYVGGDVDEDESSEHVKRLFQNTSGDDSIEKSGVNHAGRTVYMTEDDYKALGEGNHSTERGTYWSVYESTTDMGETGSMDYWFKEAYLIPVEEVTSSIAASGGSPEPTISLMALDSSGWSFNPSDVGEYTHLGFDKAADGTFDYVPDKYQEVKEYLCIAHLRQNVGSTDVTITSQFALKSEYMTRTVYFGNKTEEDRSPGGAVTATAKGEALKESDLFDARPVGELSQSRVLQNVAWFTLGHEEGLLFPGLDAGSDYRIVEKNQPGFLLERATHMQENSSTQYEPDETDETDGAKATGGNLGADTAYFQNQNGYYSLDGDTAAIKEEGGWYVNRYDPGSLSITKVLQAAEGEELTEEDKNRLFDFTLKLTAPENPEGMTVEGPFKYTVTEGEGQEKKEVQTGRLLPAGTVEGVGATDIVAEPGTSGAPEGGSTGVWKFQLAGGQTMTVTGLPVESGYTYQISEKSSSGYEVSSSEAGKEEDGEHIVTGEVKAGQEGPVKVTFTNTKKYVVGAFSIEKELKTYGKPTEEDQKQPFDFTLKLTKPGTGELLEGGPFSYTIVDSEGAEVKSGLLLPNGAEKTDDADMVAETDGSWKFQLMGGQTITVEGMPVGAVYSYDYTVSELEDADAAGRYEVSSGDGEPLSPVGGKYTVSGTVEPGNTEPEKVKFTNTQQAEPAKAGLELTKKLEDKSDPPSPDVKIEKAQYSFVVTPDRRNPEDDPIPYLSGWDAGKGALVVQNGEPDSDGKTAKATIFEEGTEFKTPGTYRYTVTEQVSGEPGVSSDVAVYTVTVEVSKVYDKDTGLYQGILKAEVTVTKAGTAGTVEGGITFTNVYRMGSIEVPLRVRKEYNGKLIEGAFTFELTGVDAGASVLSMGGKNELNSDADDPEEENGDGAQDNPEKGPGASGDGTSGSGTTGEGAQEPGGSVPPTGGSQSGEETGPGSEAQTGGETKPETQLGTESQSGSETSSGSGSSSGTETQPGSGTSSGTGASSESESQSGPGTQPGAQSPGTFGQGAAGTSGDSPDGGKTAETQPASASAPQENGGLANNQTQASDPIALRQGEPLVGPVALRVESQAFRMTALFAKPQEAEPTALRRGWQAYGQTALSAEPQAYGQTALSAEPQAYNQITISEEPQNPTTAAPQNGGEPSGTGQEETTGNETGEGETGNLPGGTQTSGTPETDPQTPEISPQTPEESGTSPEGTLPPGQTDAPGTSGTDSGSQTPGEIEQSPEGTQPPEGQETQGDPEEDLESEADEEEDLGTEKELLGESLGVPGNSLPVPTANTTLPAPSQYDKSDPAFPGESDGPWRQTNAEDGWVDFGTLTFDQAGTYTYELKEVEGQNLHIHYSEDLYRIVITVEEDKDTPGLLNIAGIQYLKKDGDDWTAWDGTVPVFTNELMTGGLKVEKKVTGAGGERDREFSFTVEFNFSEIPEDVTITKNGDSAVGLEIDTDGKLEFTLKGGEYVEVEGLPEGTTYTVTETDVSGDGYTTTVTDDDGDTEDGKGAIEENKQDTVLVVNDRKIGSLTVTKTVKGVGDPDKLWTFHVKLSDTSINGKHGDMFFTEGEADFTLKHGQSATAENLPPNITYTVTEEEANQDGYSTSSKGETGTIPDGTVNADFVNDKTPPEDHHGNLTVSKTVTGSGADPNKEWHFRVELSDKGIGGKYGDMTFVEGVAEFTLKHGESATATNLPAGLTYTVKESEADQDGYDTSVSGNAGTIPAGGTARAEYVNHKDAPPPPPPSEPEKHYGGLTVAKTVIGTGGEPDRNWHFRVELSDKSINGQYGGMSFNGGVAELTLRHGESVSAQNLPAGVTYTVTELEAGQDGYATKSAGEAGTIPADSMARAEFVNGKNETPPPPETVSQDMSGNAGDRRGRDMPDTSDSSHIGFWLALLLLSLAGIAAASVLLIGKKKRRRKGRHKSVPKSRHKSRSKNRNKSGRGGPRE